MKMRESEGDRKVGRGNRSGKDVKTILQICLHN
jgi:hypothetical protein